MKKTISMLLIILTLAVITLASCKEGDRVRNNQYNDANDIMSKYITNLQPIEKYQNSLVNVDNATVCVMERFDSATAYAFYNNFLDGKVDAFCESCTATLRQLVLYKISEET